MARFTANTKADFGKLKLLAAFSQNAAVGDLSSNGFTLSVPGYTAVITGHDFAFQPGSASGIIESIALYTAGNPNTPIVTVTELNLTVANAYRLASDRDYLKDVLKTSDFVVGSSANDVLEGFNGNDTIQGAVGNDDLQGGNGNDRLDGGVGRDVLDGGTGTDRLEGGTGNDQLQGGTGADQLQGGTGNDWLSGGTGRDVVSGGSGNDMLMGSAGGDVLNGGSGRDTFAFLKPLAADLLHLADFQSHSDKILLQKSFYTKLSSNPGVLKDQIGYISGSSKAQDDDHFLLYNRDTGVLYYDADGRGGTAPVKIAVFEADAHGNHPMISYQDLIIG